MPVLLINVWLPAGRLAYAPPSSPHLMSHAHDTRSNAAATPKYSRKPLKPNYQDWWEQPHQVQREINQTHVCTTLLLRYHCHSLASMRSQIIDHLLGPLLASSRSQKCHKSISPYLGPAYLQAHAQSECFHVGTISPFRRGKFPPEDDRASQMKSVP